MRTARQRPRAHWTRTLGILVLCLESRAARLVDHGTGADANIRPCDADRMRNATILVLRLKGVATEAIKNIVLAGIGKLIVVDPDDVAEGDLGAGFFFRDEDVGKKVR